MGEGVIGIASLPMSSPPSAPYHTSYFGRNRAIFNLESGMFTLLGWLLVIN